MPKFPHHPSYAGQPIPYADPDMPMWKEVVCEVSAGFMRRVEVLGSDETGYVVSVMEQGEPVQMPGHPYKVGLQPCTPPRTFQVFMPLTAEQIVSIFSYRSKP